MNFKSDIKDPEFDEYSNEYHQSIEHPIRKFFGGNNQDVFQEHKTKYIIKKIKKYFNTSNIVNILDFGCGTGDLLKCLNKELSNELPQLNYRLSGTDISQGMLDQVEKFWPDYKKSATFELIQKSIIPFKAGIFDLIVTASVFHHIPKFEHITYFKEIYRVLKPGGYFFLIEHNPLNPILKWIFENHPAPADINAELLYPDNTKKILNNLGLNCIQHEYMLFFPPRLRFAFYIEKYLKRLPLGGQYVLLCRKQ